MAHASRYTDHEVYTQYLSRVSYLSTQAQPSIQAVIAAKNKKVLCEAASALPF